MGIISFIIAVIFAIAIGAIAERKGYNFIVWLIFGFFFNIITFIVVLLLPKK